MSWKYLFYVLCFVGAANWFLYEREIQHPPGIRVPEEPTLLPTDKAPWTGDAGLRYRSLARLVLKGRLLSRKNITLGSWDHISPVDLGLGWQGMSDSGILAQLDLSQHNAPIGGTRFLAVKVRNGAEINTWPKARRTELWSQLTHVHAIPATSDIEKALARLRPGQILTLDGQLVEIRDSNGRITLSSSIILGDYDCEVMWVESVRLSE